MAQASPLTKGLPFFVFMAAGTFVLSLFVQQRNDFAVRVSRQQHQSHALTTSDT